MKEKVMHPVHQRQVSSIPPAPTGSGFTGATTVTDNDVNTASLLLDETATGNAGGVPTTLVIAPTFSSSTASATASDLGASDSDPISIGAVVGTCFGVAAGLAALLGLVYHYILKNCPNKLRGTGKEAERRRSGRELWVKMEDKDGDGNYEKYSIKHAAMTSVSLLDGTTVGRSITVKSAKSAKTFKSLGYGTNLGLAETFKTPDLPPHLELADADIGSGRSFVGHNAPSAPFTRAENPPISWDGETVRDRDSYLSFKHGNNSIQIAKQPVSPAIVVSHQTPPAAETTLPQWERAEIVRPEGAEDAYAAMDEPRHPDAAAARSSEETIRRPHSAARLQSQRSCQVQSETANPFGDQNPFEDLAAASAPRAAALTPKPNTAGGGTTSDSDSFFTTRSDLTVRTGAFAASAAVAAAHHERMDSNERAMASLIAALNISQEEARERLSAAIAPSMRESSGSRYSLGVTSLESKDSEVLDENSFKQFPLPPTGVQHRNVAP